MQTINISLAKAKFPDNSPTFQSKQNSMTFPDFPESGNLVCNGLFCCSINSSASVLQVLNYAHNSKSYHRSNHHDQLAAVDV